MNPAALFTLAATAAALFSLGGCTEYTAPERVLLGACDEQADCAAGQACVGFGCGEPGRCVEAAADAWCGAAGGAPMPMCTCAGEDIAARALCPAEPVWWFGTCASAETAGVSQPGRPTARIRLTRIGQLAGGDGTILIPDHAACTPEGLDCEVSIPIGTHIAVLAWPHSGSRLVAWGGICEGVAGVCDFLVLRDTEVSVTFERIEP